ncbi:MAG: hypothetical protein WAM24_00090, partial [Ignavibacteriaceae bacterium]
CNKDVVLAGRIIVSSGEDVSIIGELWESIPSGKDSFEIPCFLIIHKGKTFTTHQSFFHKHFYFLKNIERAEQ